MRNERIWPRGVRLAVLALICLGSLFPLYFLVVTAFKSTSEFDRNYFLPPRTLYVDNLVAGLDIVGRFALNSVFIALMTAAIVLFVVIPAVYAFTWLRFPGKERIYAIAVSTLLVPAVLTFVPQYVLTRQLGLLDSSWGVILPFVATAIGLAVFLLRSFFSALPDQLIEAARVDGAHDLQILGSIVLPLTIPSVVTIAVVTIVTAWNAFLWPLVAITSESKRTISVAVTFLAGSGNFPDVTTLMGGYLAASLPLILIMSVLLRFFIRGVMEGAVKG